MKLLVIIASFLTPLPLLAHGIGNRIDLAIPLDIYLGAASAVLILSFLIIAFLGKQSKRYDEYPSYRFGIRFSSFLTGILKTVSVIFLGVLLFAGFFGDQTPTDNILPIFVWVAFTVFLTYFVAFIGNIWQIINPWKALHEFFDRKEKFSLQVAWPVWLGVWPAFVFFFVFRFFENIYQNATDPKSLAFIIVGFSVVTFAGMILFGRKQWLKAGDPFSVFYRFLSYFAIFSYEKTPKGKSLILRLPAIGLLQTKTVSFSEMAFVLLMLTTVSFDGISSTAYAASFVSFFLDSGMNLIFAKTVLLVAVFALFAGVYAVFTILIRNYAGSTSSVVSIAKRFVLSLLPIAIVYEVAHFTTLLITEGQRVFILFSDPFGYEWNIFGTALNTVNYGFINFKLLWNIEITLILLGHIASIYIAHMVALMLFTDARTAVRSQVPVLILMIAYTVLGLWILAQPPVLVG